MQDAHSRTEAMPLPTCVAGGIQAFHRLPELLLHGSDDIKLSVAQVHKALRIFFGQIFKEPACQMTAAGELCKKEAPVIDPSL